MNKPKYVFSIFFFTLFLFVFTGCSNDDGQVIDDQQNTASTNFIANAVLMGGRQNGLSIDTFMVNVKEIELEFEDDGIDSDGDGSDDDYFDDIELDGPFELLFTPTGTSFPIGNIEIPMATFEEIEFDISRSRNQASDLFDKSIRITGTIDEVPFEFWHDFEEELEIDFENELNDIVIEVDGTTVVINFDLSILFDENTIDLSSAQDGNQDGFIEISPEDPDGNRDLAQQIRDLIKDNIDLLDD